jgi:HAD superfamily hydrolase (TIGR01490 family)
VATTLALFDLDHTLLTADSDYLWGRFLAATGLVDGADYETRNARYYAQYQAGALDIHEFLRFALAPLARVPLDELLRMRARFLAEQIAPVVAAQARPLLARHRAAGHLCLIVTATNRFITGPIAALLGADALIATEPAFEGGRFTGAALDPPCYRDGKVARVGQWQQRYAPGSRIGWAYGDSGNDLALLAGAACAVAVDPDPALAAHAARCAWPVISLRDGPPPWRCLGLPV